MNQPLRGIVNLIKPQDMTSSDAVVKVRGILRRATGEKQIKVGHFGTLDPMATGVLPIGIGTATRLFDYLLDKQKTYEATFLFGTETDTLDVWGKTTVSDGKIPMEEQIIDATGALTGQILQTPPAYSAKSVDGKRAYEYARKGVEIELKTVPVTVYSFEYLGQRGAGEFAFKIVCSGGTYIRSLARDLAHSLGTVAVMSSLNRLSSGKFRAENGVTMEQFEDSPLENILPVECALDGLKVYELSDSEAHKALNGVDVKTEYQTDDGIISVAYKSRIIGVGGIDCGILRVKTRL